MIKHKPNDKIYHMQLHELYEDKDKNMSILRVHNGWVYTMWNTIDGRMSSTFVPEESTPINIYTNNINTQES